MSTLDMRTIHDAGASRRTAADIMRPDPRTSSPFSTVLETTVIFRVEDCEAVPVVDEGRPVGIVTDRDVALALPDYTDLRDRPVSDIMRRGLVSVRPDDTLELVRHGFSDHKVRHVLVLDADDQLVGIIAWDDLILYLPAEDVCEVIAEIVERSPRRIGKKGEG
jgi:CBS domain-containing protein